MVAKIKETLIQEYYFCLCQVKANTLSLNAHIGEADEEYKEYVVTALQEDQENMKFIENAFQANGFDIQKELKIYQANLLQKTIDKEEKIIDTKILSIADTINLISYDGKYPNLCSGILTVDINGEVERFNHCLENRERNSKERLEKYPDQGNWVFDPQINSYEGYFDEPDCCYFKRQAEKPMKESTRLEIERMINQNILQSCCNGCD